MEGNDREDALEAMRKKLEEAENIIKVSQNIIEVSENRIKAVTKERNDAAQRAANAAQRAANAEKHSAALEKRSAALEKRSAALEQHSAGLEQQMAPTDYATFLDLCHGKYFSNFEIEEKSTMVTTGKFTKVDNKYYPLSLQKWTEFDSLHEKYQTRLETVFSEHLVFPSLHAMDVGAKIYGQRFPAASEQDIADFESMAVETWVMVALLEYLNLVRGAGETSSQASGPNAAAAAPTGFPLSLLFRSYPYGIDADPNMDDDDRPAYISAMTQAMAQEMESRGRPDAEAEPPKKRTRSTSGVRKFYPDKWLLRSDDDSSVVPILVMEYKAAHKLRAHTVQMALAESDDLIQAAIQQEASNKTEVAEDRKAAADAVKATARVLVQAFHYMIEFGLRYSYVTSGEALVLLKIDLEDPRTLYYHFCAPGRNASSERSDGADGGTAEQAGSARHTAVALVLTMALLAVDAPAMTQRWKRRQQARLEQWPTPYAENPVAGDSQESGGTGWSDGNDEDKDGDYGGDHASRNPRQGTQGTLSGRTYATRSASRSGGGGGSSSGGSGGGSSGGSGQTRPAGQQTKQYCTQACLLGLRNNGPLDPKCPNFRLHALYGRKGKKDKSTELFHGLTAAQLAEKLQVQLADDLDDDCDALDKFGKFGAIGMLFRLTLRDYGYCLSAKGVQKRHAALLVHERTVYEYLQAKQGDLVPVCLGMLELVVPYWTSTGAHVSHLLLMSYGGEPLAWAHKAGLAMPADVEAQAVQAWAQLRTLGIDHGDEREPNVLWNAERQRVMCIDFDRAEPIAKPVARALTTKTVKRLRKTARAGKTSETKATAGTAGKRHRMQEIEELPAKRQKEEYGYDKDD